MFCHVVLFLFSVWHVQLFLSLQMKLLYLDSSFQFFSLPRSPAYPLLLSYWLLSFLLNQSEASLSRDLSLQYTKDYLTTLLYHCCVQLSHYFSLLSHGIVSLSNCALSHYTIIVPLSFQSALLIYHILFYHNYGLFLHHYGLFCHHCALMNHGQILELNTISDYFACHSDDAKEPGLWVGVRPHMRKMAGCWSKNQQ